MCVSVCVVFIAVMFNTCFLLRSSCPCSLNILTTLIRYILHGAVLQHSSVFSVK